MRMTRLLPMCLAAAAVAGCGGTSAPAPPSASQPVRFGVVDEARVRAAEREPDQWFTPGRDAGDTYYSPLDAINDRNVDRLGFAWQYALGTKRGLAATPVVVDGVMYTSGNWGRVYALEAATGRELWTYDPGVPGQWGRYACCDVVNRGVAVRDGRVYVASLDGYLHAIDARTGQRIWRVDTLPVRGTKDFHYTVTGAPLIAGDLIVIGNSGGDFSGSRGSVSAYELRSGALRWRFYTVPRDPKLGAQDQAHLGAAIKTWDTRYHWETGGGGSAWDGMAYDPMLRLVYVGTGNVPPYTRSADKQPGHDELYIASILAIHAQSGELAWHYQETPGEQWDYDAAGKLVLTDLKIAGQSRHVLLQASKNGYLYVLDRATGEVLAANAFTYVNWTKGLDPKTHRPIPTAAADWSTGPKLVVPGATGAHDWQPMSFDPRTGWVYIPVISAPWVYVSTARAPADVFLDNAAVSNFFLPAELYNPQELEPLLGKLPPLKTLSADVPAPLRSQSSLRAVDPLSGKTVWEQPGSDPWDGGVLSTGGNLVLRGDVLGKLNVYAADTGRLLKQIDVGTSIMAAPMTYRVNGEQFIAVLAGYGGAQMAMPFPTESAAYRYGNAGRILAFKLGGGAVPKPPLQPEQPFPLPPPREGSAAQIAQGGALYARYCGRCHVFGRGVLPDLRRLAPETHQLFYEIVLNGVYEPKGMARWDDVLSRADAEAIHAFLLDQAWTAYRPEPHAQD